MLEAEPQVSFTELSRLQAEVTAAVRKDPAVGGVVSVVGVGQLNPTPNVVAPENHAASPAPSAAC